MMQKNTWIKNGDNIVSLKFRKTFLKPQSWNKLSVETVEQATISKIEVDQKRCHVPQFPVTAADWTQQGKRSFQVLYC